MCKSVSVCPMNIERFKYPRTPHLPWSPGATSDDKWLRDFSVLESNEVVITLKMDGENTTIYPDGYTHARSTTNSYHESREHISELAARIGADIPEGWHICGENMWAVHSIEYTDLGSLFKVFSIWDGPVNLDWDTTEEWSHLIGLDTVPVIYRGPWQGQDHLDEVFAPYSERHEGYVVRTAKGFDRDDFGTHMAKWVRKGHVQTDKHWAHGPIRRNGV